MNETDLETPKTPPRREVPIRAARRKSHDSIERYAALEFPRESIAWLLNPTCPEDWRVREGLAPAAGNRVRAPMLPLRGL